MESCAIIDSLLELCSSGNRITASALGHWIHISGGESVLGKGDHFASVSSVLDDYGLSKLVPLALQEAQRLSVSLTAHAKEPAAELDPPQACTFPAVTLALDKEDELNPEEQPTPEQWAVEQSPGPPTTDVVGAQPIQSVSSHDTPSIEGSSKAALHLETPPHWPRRERPVALRPLSAASEAQVPHPLPLSAIWSGSPISSAVAPVAASCATPPFLFLVLTPHLPGCVLSLGLLFSILPLGVLCPTFFLPFSFQNVLFSSSAHRYSGWIRSRARTAAAPKRWRPWPNSAAARSGPPGAWASSP